MNGPALTPHFARSEFVLSQTAVRLGIDNTPSPEAWDNLQALALNILEPARAELGPLRISSGYRSPSLNLAIGGAVHSQHISGEAADVIPVDCSLGDLYRWIVAHAPFDQAIYEFTEWVHVSHKRGGPQRGHKLLAWRHAGEVRYVPLYDETIKAL